MMWPSRNFSLSVIEFGGSGTGWKFIRALGLGEDCSSECTVADGQMVFNVAEPALQYSLIRRCDRLFRA